MENQISVPKFKRYRAQGAVVNAVSKDKNSIGFGGAAYAKGIKDIAVKKDAASKAFLPIKKNIESGEYPISRFLYILPKQSREGAIKKFIDWALSKEGQSIVNEVGYFPVKR